MTMTSRFDPAAIFAGYVRLEVEANKKPGGADVRKIIATLAEIHDMEFQQIADIVINNGIMGPV